MSRTLLATVFLIPVGCASMQKPVARDPLLQKKRAVPGDLTAMPNVCEADHPLPPAPPVEQLAPPHREN